MDSIQAIMSRIMSPQRAEEIIQRARKSSKELTREKEPNKKQKCLTQHPVSSLAMSARNV